MLRSVADLHQLAIILGHEMAHTVLAHSVSASLSAGLCLCEGCNLIKICWYNNISVTSLWCHIYCDCWL